MDVAEPQGLRMLCMLVYGRKLEDIAEVTETPKSHYLHVKNQTTDTNITQFSSGMEAGYSPQTQVNQMSFLHVDTV